MAIVATATADLVSLIRSGHLANVRDQLVRWRPPELAEALAELRSDDQVIAFRVLPRRIAATVFEYMPPEVQRSEEHTSELQSPMYLVCRLLLEKKKYTECMR